MPLPVPSPAPAAPNFHAALLDLAMAHTPEFDPALKRILRVDAETLGVERVSMWFFDEDKTAIVCRALHLAHGPQPEVLPRLAAVDYPRYFSALGTQRVIAAGSARTDERTSEFAAGYLAPLDIYAMLDVPVWRQGRLVGVLCHEHTGAVREWTREEQIFATAVAGSISLALETTEHAGSEEVKSAIVAAALDCIITIDPSGYIVAFNAAAEKTFGWTREQVLGRDLADLIIPPAMREMHRAGLRRYLETGESRLLGRRVEVSAIREDGTEFPVELTLAEIQTGGLRYFTAFLRDISARHALEQELQALNADLERRIAERTAELGETNAALRVKNEEIERANRAKSEFLSRMSHELRTPMNSILGFAQVLQRKSPTPDAQKSIGHILKAGRHLLALINEVLDIARIEADRLSLSSEPVSVSQAVAEAVALIQPLADERGCTLHDEVKADAQWVAADRQRLAQVLLNLLANAVKYNRPGGSVTLSCAPREGVLRITVADTGHGIAADKMPLLFTPFERIGGEARASEGTGLGLALSRGLMEAMGGTITAESTLGVGSAFHLDLPPAEDPQQRLHRRRIDGTDAPADDLDASFLYIEDNLANLSLIETILSDRPHLLLHSAVQGRLGLELARQHHPDLILLDLHLPDMTGDHVLRQLKSDDATRHIPVIVISADATTRHIKQILADGAAAYLTKPLDVDEFLATVERLVRPKSLPQ